MEKLKKQTQTIKNGWIIKMDKKWTKGLKCSKMAEIEFIIESQTSTVWKQQYHVLWNSGQMPATIYTSHLLEQRVYKYTKEHKGCIGMTAEGLIHVFLNSNLKTKVPGTQKVDRYQNLHMGKKVRQ